jgi:cell division protein FtsL
MNKTATLYRILIPVFVISVGALVYIMNVGIEERHEMKAEISTLGTTVANRDSVSGHLNSQITTLKKENDSLTTEIETLTSIETVIKKPAKPNLSKYRIKIFSPDGSNQVVQEIQSYTLEEGFSMGIGVQSSTRPNWLASKNTIFYFNSKTKKLAEKVAADLKFITGQSWRVKSGDASDMTPTKALYRIDIHYPI